MSDLPPAWPPDYAPRPPWQPSPPGWTTGSWPPPPRGPGATGLGDLLGRALEETRRAFVPDLVPLLLPVAAVLAVVAAGVDAITSSWMPAFTPATAMTRAELDTMVQNMQRAIVPVELISIAFSLVAGIAGAACYGILARRLRAQPMMDRPRLYTWAIRRFLVAIGQVLVFPLGFLILAVAVGAVSILALGGFGVLVILGEVVALAYIALRLGLASTALYADGEGPIESLRTSWELTRRRTLRMLGAVLLMGLLSLAVGLVAGLATLMLRGPLHAIASGLTSLVTTMLVMPVTAAFWVGLLDSSRGPSVPVAEPTTGWPRPIGGAPRTADPGSAGAASAVTPRMPWCPACGMPVPARHLFCEWCGHRLPPPTQEPDVSGQDRAVAEWPTDIGANRSRHGLLVVVGLTVVIVIGSVASFLVFRGPLHTVTGTFVLHDTAWTMGADNGIEAIGGSRCTGADGWSDVTAASRVVIRDESGTTLGTTSLGTGTGDLTTCTFRWRIDGVPDNARTYVIDVGERGDFTYGHADMVNRGWSVADHLGD